MFGDYPQVELEKQLASKEKEAIEAEGQVSYAEEDNYLIVRVNKPKKLSSRFGVLLYMFGYSKNTVFAAMPKIRIIAMANKCRVFNAKKRAINSGVLLEFGENYLILKIPLKLLGEPDYVLTSLKAYRGNLPIDAAGFRKVKIK